jgi:SAM-dependent methyltransferase
MSNRPNANISTADFEFAALNEARNYRAALLSEFKAYLHGNVLEVGSGIGQITSELMTIPEIRQLTSIEPDAALFAQSRARFPQHDLIQGTVSDLGSETQWNAILSVSVLEHIEDDREELDTYRRLLLPATGALCLFVPARTEIYAPIDKDFGHFRRYTRPDLRKKLEDAGMSIVRLHYYNSVGYFAWWVLFCLLKKRSFDVAQVRLFDRAVFPAVHGFESHIHRPPIGQSLLAVAVAR